MSRVLSEAVPSTPVDRRPTFRQTLERKASINMKRSSKINVIDATDDHRNLSLLSNRNKENDGGIPTTTSRENLQADGGSSLNLPSHANNLQSSAWQETSIDGSSI